METLFRFSLRLLPVSSAVTCRSIRFPVSRPDPSLLLNPGDPVLHEKAREVNPDEIGSDRIQKIIDDMVKVMRVAPGVGLAAPQIGVPLRTIVMEDTKEFISYAPKEEIMAQERRHFDLLVLVNPVLKESSKKKALFFEGCLSVDGFRALVERYLEVVVTGFSIDKGNGSK